MLPFTADVFFAQFESYNDAVWPAQLVAVAMGLVALALILRPVPQSGRIVSGTLAIFWLWNGVVYHWLTFAEINFVAPAFAILFVLAALLVGWIGLVRGRLDFAFAADVRGIAGVALVLFALVGYPLANIVAGHGWPQMPVFGVAPCPTTLFTLGVLLLARGRTPWLVAAIPLTWALIGTTAAWFLAVPEDLSLLAAALVFIAAGLTR